MNLFFGGGATFFALEPKDAHVADINKKLIAFYEDLVKNYVTVKEELAQLQKKYDSNRKIFLSRRKEQPEEYVDDPNAELYYAIRDMFNDEIKRKYSYATIYYFINKTAYSGMIRYNKQCKYNVPYGRYAHFNPSLLNDRQYKLLKNVELSNESYEHSFRMAQENDFLFLDPPYDTVFSSYGNEEFTGDFGEDEHRNLATAFKNLSTPALMIISSTALTEDLYHSYIQDRYVKNYAVNIRNRFNAKAEHIIVANYNIKKVNKHAYI